MELTKLSDEALAENLAKLVAKERSLLCVILLHVMEIAKRKSYLKSHATLFEYLTDLLKYSHGSAQRRRDAALLAIEVPEILVDVNSGALNLTQITAAQVGFRAYVRQTKQIVTTEVKRKVVAEIKHKSGEDSEAIISKILGIKPKTQIKMKRQADGSMRIEMTLTEVQWQKLARTKELLSHSVPSGRTDELVEYMCERVIAHKDKSQVKVAKAQGNENETKESKNRSKVDKASANAKGTKIGIPTGKATDTNNEIPVGKFTDPVQQIPTGKAQGASAAKPKSADGYIRKLSGNTRSFSASKPEPARTAIPAAVQRAVFTRDKCCQYQHRSSGKRCGSRWQLQIDHIQPVWAKGSNDPSNLRVLCAKHNRHIYLQQRGFQ
jgi:DNA-directed RNA polymerase subunit F